jgi:hypothetical protein
MKSILSRSWNYLTLSPSRHLVESGELRVALVLCILSSKDEAPVSRWHLNFVFYEFFNALEFDTVRPV